MAVFVAVAVLNVFYALGIAINAHLFFRFYDARNWPRTYGNIAFFQLFLNVCNILTHAFADIAVNVPMWFFTSTAFSFLSIYFLALLVISVALGKRFHERLNSKLCIAILSFIFVGLFYLCGRRELLCKNDHNCFKPRLAYTEDETAIAKASIVAFLVPFMSIFFASLYFGFNQISALKPEITFLQGLVRVCSACAAATFIFYAIFVAEAIKRYHEFESSSPTDYICQAICHEEQIYLLLSIFPVYMGYFLKKGEKKLLQESETQPDETWLQA